MSDYYPESVKMAEYIFPTVYPSQETFRLDYCLWQEEGS